MTCVLYLPFGHHEKAVCAAQESNTCQEWDVGAGFCERHLSIVRHRPTEELIKPRMSRSRDDCDRVFYAYSNQVGAYPRSWE